ncbi:MULTISPECIES: hypothetical protein [Exiguobacterium]|uniref:hypothetical protein n=1 Tax=Exiguobacterium sp. UBA1053 TaxID=1946487 RepID=UPI0025C6AC9F|nr:MULTISPECIES: hypothetical protein [Exiguobacterium]
MNEEELVQLYWSTIFLPDQQRTDFDRFSLEGNGLDPKETVWDICLRKRVEIITTTAHSLSAVRVTLAKLDIETTRQIRTLHAMFDFSITTFIAASYIGTISADRYGNDVLDLACNVATSTRLMMMGLYMQNVRQRDRYQLLEIENTGQ